METALIIGASRGIGHEFVCQLLARGWKVFATARNEQNMQALRNAGAYPIKLDVARTESIAGLEWQLDGVKLDLVVYVAGVFGPHGHADRAPTASDFDAVMHTNVLGAMQLIPTVMPLVEAAGGKFIGISSGMASMTDLSSSGGWVYRVSKTALNMAVKAASTDYPKAALAVLCPGWVKTDLGGPDASLTPEESVAGMLSVIDGLTLKDTGTFWNYAGRQLPW
jgi:NAD(P)-dependent dehydrogenase (short-subunit alcohol dehydrogenase family)